MDTGDRQVYWAGHEEALSAITRNELVSEGPDPGQTWLDYWYDILAIYEHEYGEDPEMENFRDKLLRKLVGADHTPRANADETCA